jgi:xanthine dehydrogenase accessory factor
VRDVLTTLCEVRARGGRAALATVVRTWQSAPRPAGTSMVVTDTGEVAGSVSGGCVEAAVYALGQEVIADGRPRLETYGVSDDEAFAVGLTCGGTLEVFVERVDERSWPELDGIAASVARDEPVAVATVVGGPHSVGRHLVVRPDRIEGTLGSDGLDAAVRTDVVGVLAAGAVDHLRYGSLGEHESTELDVLAVSMTPPPRMLVFGATDVGVALARAGRLLGFRVTVCDARSAFATAARFPEADEVVVDWPHRWLAGQRVDERTAIAVLTHDHKFDVPALALALRTDAGYVGALGSRRTHEDRLVRLREAGVTDIELARLHAPIGLDLGARTPEEMAVAIVAEIVQARRGGGGGRLTDGSGRIHPEEAT